MLGWDCKLCCVEVCIDYLVLFFNAVLTNFLAVASNVFFSSGISLAVGSSCCTLYLTTVFVDIVVTHCPVFFYF